MVDAKGERPEVERFFSYIHRQRKLITRDYTKLAVEKLGLRGEDIAPILAEACEQMIFRILAAIDGVGGSDQGFPRLELTLQDGSSLNADFLHKLYYEYDVDK